MKSDKLFEYIEALLISRGEKYGFDNIIDHINSMTHYEILCALDAIGD